MERVGLFDIFGGMGLLIGDILVLASFIGSAILLLAALTGRGRPRESRRPPEQMYMWSLGGLFVGTLCVMPLLLNGQADKVGFVLGLSESIAATALIASVALLAIRVILGRRA